jgi:hypothetical protein
MRVEITLECGNFTLRVEITLLRVIYTIVCIKISLIRVEIAFVLDVITVCV